jgi:methionyl-tRNA synthetase
LVRFDCRKGLPIMTAYYLTTPIYYANDVPHIGHAYATVAADAIARYQRLHGRDVFLLTGTDEHGVNIERIAAQHALTPQQHVDGIATHFRNLWSQLDITYDGFIRTTDQAHRTAVLALWQRLRASGDLYRGVYEGQYCPRCEAYYQEDELIGQDCPVHRLPCDQVREENWFFRLSRYQDALEQLVRETDFVQPEARRNEVLGALAEGLRDFSASRRLVRWGLPVPDSADEVIYVWVDALANYLTGVGFADDPVTFERYWPADLHLVGKEIIRFHCLYWPALLLSAGLPVPRQVFAHGWLTKDRHKISKTTGNTVDPAQLVTEFGSDAVRYYFLRAIAFGQDGDYTRQGLVARYNADLANDFGNLVQRATTLAARSATPLAARSATPVVGDGLEAPEQALRAQAAALADRVAAAFEHLALDEAVAAIGDFVNKANRYIQITAPWELAKAGATARLAVVLDHVVEAARLAAWYYVPIIPRAAAEAHKRLTGSVPEAGQGCFGALRRGNVTVGPPLFPRVALTE